MRRLLNAGRLVETALPAIFLSSIGLAAAVLVARRSGADGRLLWGLGALALGLVFALSFRKEKPCFLSLAEARTRLEAELHLHTRLSAAAAGVGRWPAPEQWRAGLWRWNWRRLLVLPLGSVVLLAGAVLWPIFPAAPVKPLPLARPPALEKVESWLEALAQTEALEPESLAALRQEAQQLARQDPAEWYSHASLEAADHLKEKLQAGLRTLGDNTARLEKLLGQSPAEADSTWSGQLQSALAALEGNVPGLDRALAMKLAGLDASKFKSLTPEQVEALRRQLAEAKAAGRAGGNNPSTHQDGDGETGEESEGGDGLGQGGTNHGPGTGPLKLGETPVALGTKETEGLQNGDLSRAALGDALGMSAGQHATDHEQTGRAASGGEAAAGEAAGAVWQQPNLVPEERKRLQQFFQ